MSAVRARALARAWVRTGDFLTAPRHPAADFVVGNPPYVRLEDVPPPLTAAYRARWATMAGRADLYVGFFEAGLAALRPGGVLSFICADRWMMNQYGAGLRRLVEDGYAVDASVTLHDADAFEDKVAAYPAVVVLRRGPQGEALVAEATAEFGAQGARSLAAAAAAPRSVGRAVAGPGYEAAWATGWPRGGASWPTGRPSTVAAVAALEARHPLLADPATGTRIGIGVATGLDRAFLTRDPEAAEPDRLLPLAVAADLASGRPGAGGVMLMNPWDGFGELVDLPAHPRLAAALARHEPALRARHVGRRNPDRWWRTIDKVAPGLAEQPKLLLGDLRHRVVPVLEPGGLYPHHNLFYVTSTGWDLEVLGGLLLSDFGTLFVSTYSPRMQGGALRITAQYLRRVRVPGRDSLGADVAAALRAAFRARDVDAATLAASHAYGSRPPKD